MAYGPFLLLGSFPPMISLHSHSVVKRVLEEHIWSSQIQVSIYLFHTAIAIQMFLKLVIFIYNPYIHNMYSLKFTAMMVGIYDESKKAEEAAVAVESVVESLIKANY